MDCPAEINATAAGIHILHRRATSEDIKVSTISVNIPVTRFKLDTRFDCRPVISEVDPINLLEDQAAGEV